MVSIEVSIAGERGVRVECSGAAPCPALTRWLLTLESAAMLRHGEALIDTAPAYTSLTVFADREQITVNELQRSLRALVIEHPLRNTDLLDTLQPEPHEQVLELPVWYDGTTGADLKHIATAAGKTVSEVIRLHSKCAYFAFANGFAPGFCYLGEVPDLLATPRLSTPRPSVPAGSVGIADRQTAVYPTVSPGGWNLIGRCPLALFDLSSERPTRITLGDWVRFMPIDRAEFLSLGGQLP